MKEIPFWVTQAIGVSLFGTAIFIIASDLHPVVRILGGIFIGIVGFGFCSIEKIKI
jgi:hypothetical protein